MLKEKRILLGVTGSIAAYKAVELVRELALLAPRPLSPWATKEDACL